MPMEGFGYRFGTFTVRLSIIKSKYYRIQEKRRSFDKLSQHLSIKINHNHQTISSQKCRNYIFLKIILAHNISNPSQTKICGPKQSISWECNNFYLPKNHKQIFFPILLFWKKLYSFSAAYLFSLINITICLEKN